MDRIARLKAFLKDSPEDPFLQHALALEYIKLGNDADARALFETLLGRNPGYIGSYYHLAKLLERAGDTSQALECYQKGMLHAQQAGDRHALNELRMAYEELTD